MRNKRRTLPNVTFEMADEIIYYTKEESREFKILIEELIKKEMETIKHLKSLRNLERSADVIDVGSNASNNNANEFWITRSELHLSNLRPALNRINAGTYGVDRKTGKKIPLEELRLCPHRTLSTQTKKLIEADK